jgi:transcriptional regulator with XRE-family HTH domain
MNWMQRKRKDSNLNQDELAAKLQIAGFDVGRTTISNWETGRSTPPFDDPKFVRALANALRISVIDVLSLAGYELSVDKDKESARRAADIVNQLSQEKQRLALRILEDFLEAEQL